MGNNIQRIIIQNPPNNIEERQYSIESLLNLILDQAKTHIEYNVSPVKDTIIKFDNIHKNVVIKDSFWNNWQKSKSYLCKEALPTPKFGRMPFINEPNIVSLYGDIFVEEEDNHVILGVDILASTFFMLTRWEEYINSDRDKHNRFSGLNSVAYRFGFLSRPIVNEYAKLLENIFVHIGIDEGLFKKRHYDLTPTHDIDYLKPPVSIKTLIGDILKRKSFRLFVSHITNLISNPYDTYDFLMNCSECAGVKSHFYFYVCQKF